MLVYLLCCRLVCVTPCTFPKRPRCPPLGAGCFSPFFFSFPPTVCFGTCVCIAGVRALLPMPALAGTCARTQTHAPCSDLRLGSSEVPLQECARAASQSSFKYLLILSKSLQQHRRHGAGSGSHCELSCYVTQELFSSSAHLYILVMVHSSKS